MISMIKSNQRNHENHVILSIKASFLVLQYSRSVGSGLFAVSRKERETLMIGRAFSPYGVLNSIPGALPQAGIKARRWRWRNLPRLYHNLYHCLSRRSRAMRVPLSELKKQAIDIRRQSANVQPLRTFPQRDVIEASRS